MANEKADGLDQDAEFGHYRIVSRIGKGGMGEVYLAQDMKLDRRVALKILPEEFAEDADRMNRFIREAKSASALNHPNIITIHEIGESDGTHFIATEFIDGETLSEYARANRLDYKSILEIAVQVASALAEAHAAGIVHRDIKPDNIMIRRDRLVKVLDFGLAKLIGFGIADLGFRNEEAKTLMQTPSENPQSQIPNPQLTNPGAVMGTPDYMSPEQARGKRTDARTDIFSLGVVLYEMITGQKPFMGETVNHTIVNILEKEPPPVSAFARDCPAELERIIQKTLSKNADERYGAAKDLLVNLKRLQKRLEFEEELGRASQPDAVKAEAKTRIFESSDADSSIVPPNNLAENLSALIGREKEIAEITNLLRQTDVRLLTLTGIGGTGKTRLAQTIARRVLPEFPDGVFFVALAAITDSKLVVSTIAQTLGVKEAGGKSLLEALKNHLGERRLLLVLDNFEQVQEAAPDVAELLSAAKNLKILITSREHLRLKAENEYAVPPLAVPSEVARVSFAELSNYEAVRFFVERARFAQPDFWLTEENASSVAEICRRLDGLPLAIELAAARVKLFAPQAILARLSNSLKLLTGGAKDLPERQRTMRGAIQWSYDLLEAEEKRLLNRLAVFAGGFTLEGAEAVDNAKEELSADLLDAVASLVDKSLLNQREMADGEPRFRMLAVVREFALEQLEASGEASEIKRLHAGFYSRLAETAEPELKVGKVAQWLDTLEREHDNLRAAMEWSLASEPETALRIAGATISFWFRRGHLSEGIKWIRAALESGGEEADSKLRAKAYSGIGELSWRQRDLEAAERFNQESLRLAREIDDKYWISCSLGNLGIINIELGDLRQGKALTEESLLIARELNDRTLISFRLNALGEIARQQEDYEAAREFYEEALTLARQESFKNVISIFTQNLAAIACVQGDNNAALSFALESLKICEEVGDKIYTGVALGTFAALSAAAGETEKAARLFGAAQAIYDATGFKLDKTDQIFFDRYIREARAAMGDEAFEAARDEGRGMPLQEAIALARGGESDLQSTMTAHTTDDSRSGATSFQTAADSTDQPHADAFATGASHGVSSAEYAVGEVKKHKFAWLGALGVLVIALAATGYFTYFRAKPINSIAVLPFVNVGDAGGDGEYLSDGLSDNLINTLSRLPQLKVIARSSSFRFRGENVDVQDAARKLGVEAILTGRVARRGDDLQISVELINASDNTRIWGDIYNRKVSGALSVPEEIAGAVSEKLQLKLSGEQERQIAKRITNNPQAYQLHLNGVFFRRKNGAENIRKAIEYQNQAIALDTNFALAYVELSINYANLTEIGSLSPQEGMSRARAVAEKALALDETLAEAHYNIARIKKYEYDWAGAELAFKRAIELNPNLAAAHTIYAEYLSQLGRFDEAMREIRLAQELDPLRVGLIGNEGNILYYARRYTEAIEKMQEGLKPEPENAPARVFLGQAYTAAGQYENAIRELQTARQTDNETSRALLQLGRAFALSGKRDESAAILKEIKQTKKYVSPAALAVFYAALGEREAAFKSLEEAYAERDFQLQFLKVEPGYDTLREDARFKAMLKRLNLAE